jgi:hypothetical protein
MESTTQTTNATTLETTLAQARKKAPSDLTKFELYALSLTDSRDPLRFEKAAKLATITFADVVMKRLSFAEAKANGAPQELIDTVTADCDELEDNARVMVEVLALYGKPFWN